tara:strand:- start:60 stop:233 length:174 start_codon:yes stop_codon:yes gene_type:complete
MNVNMTEAQQQHVDKYSALYERLSLIEAKMLDLKEEAAKLLAELEVLRVEENKLFEE